MITESHVKAVSKMRKAELIAWLEARGMFSLMRGWRDYTRDELENEVLNEMGREREAAS